MNASKTKQLSFRINAADSDALDREAKRLADAVPGQLPSRSNAARLVFELGLRLIRAEREGAPK